MMTSQCQNLSLFFDNARSSLEVANLWFESKSTRHVTRVHSPDYLYWKTHTCWPVTSSFGGWLRWEIRPKSTEVFSIQIHYDLNELIMNSEKWLGLLLGGFVSLAFKNLLQTLFVIHYLYILTIPFFSSLLRVRWMCQAREICLNCEHSSHWASYTVYHTWVMQS